MILLIYSPSDLLTEMTVPLRKPLLFLPAETCYYKNFAFSQGRQGTQEAMTHFNTILQPHVVVY